MKGKYKTSLSYWINKLEFPFEKKIVTPSKKRHNEDSISMEFNLEERKNKSQILLATAAETFVVGVQGLVGKRIF